MIHRAVMVLLLLLYGAEIGYIVGHWGQLILLIGLPTDTVVIKLLLWCGLQSNNIALGIWSKEFWNQFKYFSLHLKAGHRMQCYLHRYYYIDYNESYSPLMYGHITYILHHPKTKLSKIYRALFGKHLKGELFICNSTLTQ